MRFHLTGWSRRQNMTSDRQNKSTSKAAAKAPRKDAASNPKPVAKPAKPAIPSILLEGDEAPAPPQSGPGQRFALGVAGAVGLPPGSEYLRSLKK